MKHLLLKVYVAWYLWKEAKIDELFNKLDGGNN